MSWAVEEKGYSQSRACGLVGIDPRVCRYRSTRQDDAELRESGRAALAARGYTVKTGILDVAETSSITNVADNLAHEGRAADILVCNAGIAQSGTPSEDMNDADWDRMININPRGRFSMLPLVRTAHARSRRRRNRQYRLNVGNHRQQATSAKTPMQPRPVFTT